jgi:hypothetical protein
MIVRVMEFLLRIMKELMNGNTGIARIFTKVFTAPKRIGEKNALFVQ